MINKVSNFFGVSKTSYIIRCSLQGIPVFRFPTTLLVVVDDVGVEASTTEPLKHKIGKLVELNVVVVDVAVIFVSGVVVRRMSDEEDVVTSVVVRTLSVF